jgi:hypothetical protein
MMVEQRDFKIIIFKLRVHKVDKIVGIITISKEDIIIVLSEQIGRFFRQI